MSANRDESSELVESLADDQVDALLVDAGRLAAAETGGTWPPAFVGMIKDAPADGSSPGYIDDALAGGFGS